MEKPKYDVFLSHASADKPVVEELARLLKKREVEPWLDKWNLIPGEPWQEAIEKALDDCAACAVCLGPSGTGPWQNEEMRAALARRVSDRNHQSRVIPVLLPQAERGEASRLPPFLRANTWVEFRETLDDEKALHRLICGIRGIPPGPDPGEAVAEGACPYRGLQVFDVGDALFFFGREALTGWLLDKLRADRIGSRFLAIVGPSGSGKSSLARAGLLASLKRGEIPGSDTWPAAICKPGAQPLESLAVALSGATRLGDSPSAIRDLIRDLGADPRMLHLTTRLSLRDAPADRRFVVLVDQFEEVFTLCPDEAQRQAIIANLLHAALAADGQTVVVLTLRADFYGRCAAYPDLAAAVSDRQSLVGSMTRDELRSAIERPAYLAGCELEGGLADLLLNEVESQPGSLPLLEHALLQIWDRKEGGRRLTIDACREIGGVAGALEKHAEEVYAGFSEEEKETYRRIFLRLVQVDEQGRATKRRLGLDEIAPATSPVETVVSRLTDARLLTTGQEKQPTVELAHEALLINWERLKQWIEQDREVLRTRRRLDEAVAEWLGKDRDPSFLLEGGRLAQVEELAGNHQEEMAPAAQELLAASVAERDRERQRELAQAKALEEEQRRRADAEHQRAEEQARARRRQRKWTFISSAAAALALIAAISTGYLLRVAEQKQKIALSGHLAERSGLLLKNDRMLSLLLSIEATRLAKEAGHPHLPPAESALRSVLNDNTWGIPLPTGRIRAASLSIDEKRLALAGTDGVISLWSLEPGREPARIASFQNGPPGISTFQIAVSPGGKWLLVNDRTGTSRLRKIDGTIEADGISLEREDWMVGSDPFSRDGHWLLTRGKDSKWKIRDLWKVGLPTLASLEINPRILAFSSDGHWLAAVEPGSIVIFDLRTLGPKVTVTQIPQEADMDSLAFSSDSRWLVAGYGAYDEKEMGTGLAATAIAWRTSPSEQSSTAHLDRCVWDIPNAPSLQDSELGSRIGLFTICSALEGASAEIKRLSVDNFLFGIGSITALSIDRQRRGMVAIGTSQGKIYYSRFPGLGVDDGGNNFQGSPGPVHLLAFAGRRLIHQSANEPPRVLGESALPPGFTHSNFDRYIIAVSPGGLQLRGDSDAHDLVLSGARGVWPVDYSPKSSRYKILFLFSPNSRRLIYASPGEVPLVWDVDASGKPSPSISLSSNKIRSSDLTSFAVSPDSHWFAVGNEMGESRFWNLRVAGNDPEALVNHRGRVNALAFSQRGDLLASAGDDGNVRISKISESNPPVPQRSPGSLGEAVVSLAFLLDGRLAIGLLSGRVLIWKPGQEVYLENRSTDPIYDFIVSPKSTFLAGVSRDNTQIWYFNDHRELSREPVQLPNAGKQVVFTADENFIENFSREGTDRWDLRIDKILEIACRTAGRNLTEREWREYIPSEPYQEREPCPEFPKAFD